MIALELATPCSQLTDSSEYEAAQGYLAELLITAIDEAWPAINWDPKNRLALAIEVAYAALTDTFDGTTDQTIAEWFLAACREANVSPPLLVV